MPKLTKIQDYLSQDELETRYRQATNPAERSHWHIIWLLSSSKTVREVAQVTAYSEGWVRELVRRYNKLGPAALADQRLKIVGAPALLSQELQSELAQTLQLPPPDGGLWNGQKVADWIAQKLGTKIHRQRGWDYLKRLDYTLQQPRPHHAKADVLAQNDFKKTARANR